MGFFFTIVFIITAYLAPATIFGTLDQYHIQTYIAALAIIFSLFSASGSRLLTMTQTWAIAGLCACVAISIMVNGWLGGGPKALLDFVPEVSTFFMIVMNCKKKWHLQVLAATLFFAATFIIGHAMWDISQGLTRTDYLLRQNINEETTDYIVRIRGLSFLSDPNDLAQFLVSLIPIMFLFWKQGASIRNTLFVYLPAVFLFFGMYETHSRGSMVALMVVCMVAFRRKIGTGPAIAIGILVFAALTAAGFSGGRDVSAGEDRLEAWSTGIMLLRAHPIFGVGWQRFDEFNDITAHNTFVVCAAELGLIGVFCWVMLMLVTVRNAWVGNQDPDQEAKDRQKTLDDIHSRSPFLQGIPSLSDDALAPATVSGSAPMASQGHPFSGAGMTYSLPAAPSENRFALAGGRPIGSSYEEEDREAGDAEVRRMSGLMIICFAGFLTAGWFLSRAYTMCIYVNAGMAAAVYRMALDRGIAPPPMPTGRVMKLTAMTVAGLLVFIYLIIRVDHLTPH